MTKIEKELMLQACEEITFLRKRNEICEARLSMFDQLMLLFNTRPNYPSQGMGEDIVWQIKQHLTTLEEKKNA